MNLCRVVGDVVSTVKNEKLVGLRLLTVQPVEFDGRTPKGASFVAIDQAGAGVSDLVLTITEGGGVRIHFQDDRTPFASVITAIVDDLDIVADEASLVGQSCLEQNRRDNE